LFSSAAWADPVPDRTASYGFNCTPGMPTVSSGASKHLAVGGTLKQTFLPRADAFVSAFNRHDTNASARWL